MDKSYRHERSSRPPAAVRAAGLVVMAIATLFAGVGCAQQESPRDVPLEAESATQSLTPTLITQSPTVPATDTVAEPDEVLFVYSVHGDIRAQMVQGDVIVLTIGPPNDVHPAISPDGKSVLFERTNEDAGLAPVLVHRDLATGDEQEIGAGSWPAFSTDGRVAWVREGAELNEIVIGRLFSEPRRILRPLPDYSDIRHIAWAPDSSALYYEAGGSIVQHFVNRGAQPFPMTPSAISDGRGTVALLAPTMRRDDRVEVIRTCCRNERRGPFSVEVASIRFTEGGPLYKKVIPIDPRFLSPKASRYFAAYAGRITATGPHESAKWSTTGEHNAWLVSDGESLYLVDDGGGAVFVSDLAGHDGETGRYDGIAVPPYITGIAEGPRTEK